MKKLSFVVILMSLVLRASSQSTTQYLCNPIIPGFHPDPSVCCVGEDFYLVNSSFQYFPGVPIYHSKDLVNWELIGNVLDRESQLPLRGATSWRGIYAPTIRYHEGMFYMITTNIGNGGNFMVTATNPAGPWSEPIWLQQQGIDPSLWFDEDGKCYMVSNPDNTIMLCEIDPKTGKQLTPSCPLWRGTGGRYPEGPHLYKKDGYYYLLISEGGTELAHRLTIARSRHIDGPYEANPDNPLLTNCCLAGQTKQLQGTGHGDFVQAPDGSWWVVFLAYRQFEGAYHHLGRETCLAPVEWKEGVWPVVNGGQPIDTLMACNMLPQQPMKQYRRGSINDGRLGPEWVSLQNPKRPAEVCKLKLWNDKDAYGIRLYASESSLTENNRPSFIGIRQENVAFSLETGLAVLSKDIVEAGLAVYQIHDGHADLFIRKDDSGYSVVLRYRLKSIDVVVKEEKLDVVPQLVGLRVLCDGKKYRFFYNQKEQKERWAELGSIDCSLLSTEVVGGFTGITLGLYAQGDGFAEFRSFDYFLK